MRTASSASATSPRWRSPSTTGTWTVRRAHGSWPTWPRSSRTRRAHSSSEQSRGMVGHNLPMPRELTEPADLCLPEGRLNPDAVGWSRTPLHTAHLRGWGRNKRWEYWGIVTPTHIVAVRVASLDCAGGHRPYAIAQGDRRARQAKAVVHVV